jgi:hypothetical protein
VSQLRESLARRDVSKTDKYLLIVAAHGGGPISTNTIKATARQNGWKDGAQLLPGDFLKQTRQAIYTPQGWTITRQCRKDLEGRGLLDPAGVLTPVIEELEKYLKDVKGPDNARFVEEAVRCVRAEAYRSAIVLTWVGAVYLLYKYVLDRKLADFNAEARRRNPKWKDAVNEDNLSAVNEAEFLNILEHIRVLNNSEHKELKSCLDRRNTAGHPNSHSFKDVTVGAHILALITAVFKKY